MITIGSSGFCASVNGGKRSVKFNGEKIGGLFVNGSQRFGISVTGNKLKSDNKVVALSSVADPVLKESDGKLVFGDVYASVGTCINITIDDYNGLLKRVVPNGYFTWESENIYNIVPNPTNVPVVTFVDNGDTITFNTGITARKTYAMIYNSVAGTLPENTEDFNATVMGDCPFVNMRYFDPIIKTGDGLLLEYFVDNKNMDSMNSFTIGDTFTTIVKLANGTEFKKTTYAGFQYIELPAFSTAGETWFSVRCIDQNGVSSVEQFFDVLVRGGVTENHYEMAASDLETYGIVPDNSDPQVAFNNKAALSSFFAAVKEGGYNGVKMLNRTYWVDYHGTFGTQRYWRVVVRNNRLISVDEVTEQDVISNGYVTTVHGSIPVINGTFGDAVVLYFVVNGSYYECTVYDGKITSVKSVSISDIPSGKTATNRGSVPYVGEPYSFPDATYTLVYNTSTDGAHITFPNEFTVDLNGATIRATQCTDLHGGSIIQINGNYDTHIKNGYIVGNYNGFDFATTRRRCGKLFPAEGLGLTSISNMAKYCSFENLDISYSTGYEFGSGGNYGGFDYLYMSDGEENKRVDLADGQIISETGCIVSALLDLKSASTVAIGRSGQGSYQGGTRREILLSFYDSEKSYIKTIKTKLYSISKVPSGAKYMRITGYGTKAQWPTLGGSGVLGVNRNSGYPTNIVIKDCCWHDTRTCAFTLAGCNGFRVERCRWANIALETGTYQVTKILGDFEDGWQRTRNVYVNGCSAVAGNGMTILSMTYCNKLEWTNNTGFHVTSSGIEDGLFMDNSFPSLSIGRDYRSMNPHVVYLGNTIGTLSISYEDGAGNTYNTGNVDKVVPMIDTVISNQCMYGNLVLRNSKNGAIFID